MKLSIVGVGYVGLVSGACFSELGNQVYCIDVNQDKIEALKRGEVPIYEPGLDEIIQRNIQGGRLSFSTKLEDSLNESDMVFIAVGTPSLENGAVDLRAVRAVSKTIGETINKDNLLVVTKSTVPVGTSEIVRQEIQSALDKRKVSYSFEVASNPEFLKEGDAISDFMKPDRIVVGVDTDRAKSMMEDLYKPMLLNNFRVLFMDISSAEMTKYASNAMLATRISFMNDIANLCECVGADVNMVRRGMGSDSRIGGKFLYPGCGYGGSCFPKDVKGLIDIAQQNRYTMGVLQAVNEVNERQKEILFQKFLDYFNGNIVGKKVALWGLAFKPGTDDMREAPSIVIIDKLLEAGCYVSAYDPIAQEQAKLLLGDKIEYAKDIYETVKGADAIIHVTEWKEYRMPDWQLIASMMRHRVLLDGRNVFDADQVSLFLDYISIGRPLVKRTLDE